MLCISRKSVSITPDKSEQTKFYSPSLSWGGKKMDVSESYFQVHLLWISEAFIHISQPHMEDHKYWADSVHDVERTFQPHLIILLYWTQSTEKDCVQGDKAIL